MFSSNRERPIEYERIPTAEDTHGGNEAIQTGRALTADGFIMSSSTSSYDDLDFEAHEQKREGFSWKGSSSSDSSIAFDNAEMEKGEIDQTKEGLLNTETTLFLTISYLIGSALINTPSIMRYVGWSGVGVIVFIAIISAYTTIIILREFVAARNNNSGSFLSYVTLCEKRNVYWSIFITILFLLYLVLMLITTLHDIVNIVFHTTKFHEKIEDLKVTRVNEHRAGVASMGTVLFPLTLMRSPKKYSWLVYICTLLCTIVALLLTTSLGNLQRSRPETDNSNATNEVQITVHTLAIACNLIRFFGIHAILSLIISDMKDPKEAPRIIATGFAVPTIIVVIVSMMSYYTFGERITPILFEVIDMAVAKNSTFFLTISITVIKSLLCFQLCFVYILTFNTFNLFLEHIGLSTDNNCHRVLMRASTTTIVTMFTAAASHLASSLVYVNIILACFLCIAYPLVFKMDFNTSNSFQWVLHGTIIFIVATCLVALSYGVFVDGNLELLATL